MASKPSYATPCQPKGCLLPYLEVERQRRPLLARTRDGREVEAPHAVEETRVDQVVVRQVRSQERELILHIGRLILSRPRTLVFRSHFPVSGV
jgi:hypothetical protein